MKTSIRRGILLCIIACMMAACNGGQIPYGGGITVLVTNSAGQSLTGISIRPNDRIIVTCNSAPCDFQPFIVCALQDVPLVTTALSDTQVSVAAASGRFPQQTACTLSSDLFDDVDFWVGCDVLDLFNNTLTLDPSILLPTSEPYIYGDGCWMAAQGSDIGIEDDQLVAGITPSPEQRISFMKKVSGDDFELCIHMDEVAYTLMDAGGSVTYGILITDDLINFDMDTSNVVYVAYIIETDGSGNKCTAFGKGVSEDEIEGCVDETTFPTLCIDNVGGIFRPSYSSDRGITKKYYNFDGHNYIDLSDTLGESDLLYGGIVFVAINMTAPATFYVDEFGATGDVIWIE